MEAAGIDRIKLEGRHRSSRYGARVTRVFRAALDRLASGQPYRVDPAWEASLTHAALGFEVTDGLFVDGAYQRRLDPHPPPLSAVHFLVDTVQVFLESGNLETLRTEMRAGWNRLVRRPQLDGDEPGGRFGGVR
jgi:collagenase-like PrtC family protease